MRVMSVSHYRYHPLLALVFLIHRLAAPLSTPLLLLLSFLPLSPFLFLLHFLLHFLPVFLLHLHLPLLLLPLLLLPLLLHLGRQTVISLFQVHSITHSHQRVLYCPPSNLESCGTVFSVGQSVDAQTFPPPTCGEWGVERVGERGG